MLDAQESRTMTHILRFLLIFGERKKKVELVVDEKVENVELATLQDCAKRLFNLPGVILQIWDKGFDDWVDLEEGDPTPTNSRIKVEVDKDSDKGVLQVVSNAKAVPQASSSLSTLQQHRKTLDAVRRSGSQPQSSREVIHNVVDSQSPAITNITSVQPPFTSMTPFVTPMSHASPGTHRTQMTHVIPPVTHGTPSGTVGMQRLHSRIPDVVTHPKSPTFQNHHKPTPGHMYHGSIQNSTGGPLGSVRITPAAPSSLSLHWRHSPKDMEGPRFNSPEREGLHSTLGGAGEQSQHTLQVTSNYFPEHQGAGVGVLKQVVDDSQGVDPEQGHLEDADDGVGDSFLGNPLGDASYVTPVDRKWMRNFQFPEFPVGITKKLKSGLELNCNEQRTIMSAIYDAVTHHTFYPTTSDYKLLTDRLLDTFPSMCQQTQGVKPNETAWEFWKSKLMHKFKNQRKRRDAGNPEVVLRKRSFYSRPTLRNMASLMPQEDEDGFQEDGGFQEIIDSRDGGRFQEDGDSREVEELEEVQEIQEVVIKDEVVDDSEQCLFSKYNVMAADTTETGS